MEQGEDLTLGETLQLLSVLFAFTLLLILSAAILLHPTLVTELVSSSVSGSQQGESAFH